MAQSDHCLWDVSSVSNSFLVCLACLLLSFLAFVSRVSPKYNMALFLSSHPWIAAFQPLSSPALLLSLPSASPLSRPPPLHCPLRCHLCNIMFYVLWNPHRSRLQYNLDVADRLPDEHVLIGVYVNLLQSNPDTWLVGVLRPRSGKHSRGRSVLCRTAASWPLP